MPVINAVFSGLAGFFGFADFDMGGRPAYGVFLPVGVFPAVRRWMG
jgi:hypothetical protein